LLKINHPRISSFFTFIPTKLSFSANSPSKTLAEDAFALLLDDAEDVRRTRNAKYALEANSVSVLVDPINIPFAREEDEEEEEEEEEEESNREAEMVPKERNARAVVVNPVLLLLLLLPPPPPPPLLLLLSSLFSRIIFSGSL
jgi:hypothetical protein